MIGYNYDNKTWFKSFYKTYKSLCDLYGFDDSCSYSDYDTVDPAYLDEPSREARRWFYWHNIEELERLQAKIKGEVIRNEFYTGPVDSVKLFNVIFTR